MGIQRKGKTPKPKLHRENVCNLKEVRWLFNKEPVGWGCIPHSWEMIDVCINTGEVQQ